MAYRILNIIINSLSNNNRYTRIIQVFYTDFYSELFNGKTKKKNEKEELL